MAITNNQSKMTFSSMNDDFVDARFDPALKKSFQKELQDFDLSRSTSHVEIPIQFKGKFESKTQSAISNLINEVIKYADSHKIAINQSSLKIIIYTPRSWEDFTKKPLSQNVNIPAAKIGFVEGVHFIRLIIPDKITSSEIVIKTIRLVCSKIFGDLFFDENIPAKQVYKEVLKQQDQYEFDVEEKVRFCRFLGHYPSQLDDQFLEISRKNNIRGPKALEIGKTDLFKSLLTDLDHAEENAIDLINQLYIQQIEYVKGQKDNAFAEFTQKCLNTCDQSTLLLPHEKADYSKLQEQKSNTIFNSIAEKTQFVCNCIDELQECFDFISEINQQNPMVHSTARLWKETLNQRMIHLKKRGLVKVFLIDGTNLTHQQEMDKKQFPLWIWKHRLFELFPEMKSSKQALDKITALYKNSVYQKLFSCSYYLIQTLSKLMVSDQIKFSQTAYYAKVKSLQSWLQFREPFLKDVLFACRVFVQVPKIDNSLNVEKQQCIKNFNQGWAYFISFALIHQYYLTIRKTKNLNDNRDEKFLNVIRNFTLKQIDKSPAFHISLLLIEVYINKSFRLTEITSLMKDDCAVLDFFVFNRKSILVASEVDKVPTIQQYAEKIQAWQLNHLKNKI